MQKYRVIKCEKILIIPPTHGRGKLMTNGVINC